MTLLLFVNTPIKTLESAATRACTTVDRPLSSVALVTKYEGTRLQDVHFAICIGIQAWMANQKFFQRDTVVCLLADPIDLALSFDNGTPMDFEVDNYHCTLQNLSENAIYQHLVKHSQDTTHQDIPVPDIADIDARIVSYILATIPDKPSFLKQLSSVIYAVKPDMRQAIRSKFLVWLVEGRDAQSLRTTLNQLLGYKRGSRRIDVLANFFETSDGERIRTAVKIVIDVAVWNANTKKPVTIWHEAIAEEYLISQYDLKYMVYMVERDQAAQKHIWDDVLNKSVYSAEYERFLVE